MKRIQEIQRRLAGRPALRTNPASLRENLTALALLAALGMAVTPQAFAQPAPTDDPTAAPAAQPPADAAPADPPPADPAPPADAAPAPTAPATAAPAPTAPAPTAPAATAPAATAPAATAPGTAPATAAPAAEVVPAAGDAQYDAKLRGIEERVIAIKERIFNTKAKLLLLKEQILDNVIAESRAVLIHKNEMGNFFELQSVLYYLDGKKIYYQDNSNGLLNQRKEFEIYNGTATAGNHALTVEMVYRGNSDVFSYLEGYVFKLKSVYTFYAQKGRVTEVSVIGYERGGIGTDLEDKPSIKYDVKLIQNKTAKPVDADNGPGK